MQIKELLKFIHWDCNVSNTTGVNSGTGTAYPSEAPEFTPVFNMTSITSWTGTACPSETSEFISSCYRSLISREATNTHFKVFGITRWGLEHTIYLTRGEYANYYSTDAVEFAWHIVLMTEIIFGWYFLKGIFGSYWCF